MAEFAQALDLIDDEALIAEYEEHHRRVWPEVVAALRRVGIRRMRIYRLGTRLFMVYEAPDGFDPARDYQAYASDPVCREWDERMRRYQRRAPGAPEGCWWAPMRGVFDLDAPQGEPLR
jgi:L-rhamnose mutarotase